MNKVAAIIFLFAFASCTQRGCQRFKKKTQYTDREYSVTMFSGGDTIFHDKFKGIINGEEGTDGFYYFKNDTLIEISGDYIIRSVN